MSKNTSLQRVDRRVMNSAKRLEFPSQKVFISNLKKSHPNLAALSAENLNELYHFCRINDHFTRRRVAKLVASIPMRWGHDYNLLGQMIIERI